MCQSVMGIGRGKSPLRSRYPNCIVRGCQCLQFSAAMHPSCRIKKSVSLYQSLPNPVNSLARLQAVACMLACTRMHSHAMATQWVRTLMNSTSFTYHVHAHSLCFWAGRNCIIFTGNVCSAEAAFPLSGARTPLMFVLHLLILCTPRSTHANVITS